MADEVVQHYLYNVSSTIEGPTYDTFIKDGDTTNPIIAGYQMYPPIEETTVTPGDYCAVLYPFNSETRDPVVPSFNAGPLYVYTVNNEWKYAGIDASYYPYYGYIGCNVFDGSGTNIALDEGDGNFYVGSTCDKIVVSPYNKEGITSYYVEDYDSTGGYKYYGIYPSDWDIESPTLIEHTETQKVTANYGDFVVVEDNIGGGFSWFKYQYPGVWVAADQYPDLTINPEPKYKGHVQLKWTDPQDITDWKPTPATWEGTVIVRKENSAPLHRWDGDKVVRTTTRDKYKSKPYKDEDIETNKVYYYAFMPYYTKIDDPQHPIRYYTFTKCIRVETGTISYIPEIIKIDMNEDVATITYAITLPATGPYDTAKLYGKKDENPSCDNTDDIVEDISQVDDQIVVPDIDGDYFFCIQVANGTDTLTSDVVSCSGEGENPDPDYESLYSQINTWYIIHNPNQSIIIPDVWIADTQNDYTGGYFVWNKSDRKNHSYYRANAQPNQWCYTVTNQDVYAIDNVITIHINKNNNNKYEVILPTLTWNNEVFQRSYYYPGSKYYGWRMDYNGSLIRANGWYTENPPTAPSASPFNTLYDALYWTVAKFKHFTLYVDGTLWVRAN